MNKVRKNKINNIAIGLLNKDKTIKDVLIDEGYTISTANRGSANKVVQEAQDKIKSDAERKGQTPERLLEHLILIRDECWNNYLKSTTQRDKKDWMNRLQASNDTLARHILSTKQDIKTEDITEKGQSILDRYTDIQSLTIN